MNYIKLCEWPTANKLTINISKSKYVIFLTRKMPLPQYPRIDIFDTNRAILCTFGTQTPLNISAYLQTNTLTGKLIQTQTLLTVSKIDGMIAKIRHYVPLSVTIKLSRSLILPYLTHGISGWGQASKSNLEKLLRLQKRVLR